MDRRAFIAMMAAFPLLLTLPACSRTDEPYFVTRDVQAVPVWEI